MLAPVRRSWIAERVRQTGGVRVSELTELLGVSDMTVRRDLDELERQGLVAKVHGGATAVNQPSSFEPLFEVKRDLQRSAKQAIAKAALHFVQPGMTVAMSAGTTTWTLALLLAQVPKITVITNSMVIANTLHEQPGSDRTVILTGGVRTPSDGLVGPVTVRCLEQIHVDLAIMGAHGIAERAGLTTPNALEAETNRAMIACADSALVLADHSKWGVTGLWQYAQLSAIDTMIIDNGLGPATQAVLEDQVGTLVVAQAG